MVTTRTYPTQLPVSKGGPTDTKVSTTEWLCGSYTLAAELSYTELHRFTARPVRIQLMSAPSDL
ncbi:hypothetical protein PG988_009107 [Apiospora saccharicola]